MEDVLTGSFAGLLAWTLSGVAAIAIAWLRTLGTRATVSAVWPQTVRTDDYAPLTAEPALSAGARVTRRVERWLVRVARCAPDGASDPGEHRMSFIRRHMLCVDT